jgi:SAM-dependent methyltransferase
MFLLAMSVLVLEVALTRIFSVLTFYHFTYLIIALALLGFGAAGTVLTVSARFAGRSVQPGVLADAAWLYSVVVMVGFLAITRTDFDAELIHAHRDFSQLVGLLMLLTFAAAPFFFGGLCIGYLVSKSGEQINRVYFFDLLGAGCGSLGALLAINHLGAVSTIFAVATLAAMVAMLIAIPQRRFRWRYPATLIAAATLTILTWSNDRLVPLQFPPSKGVDAYRTQHRWHVVARVDVDQPELGYPTFGGSLSRAWNESRPPLSHRMIYQDGLAPTGIVDLHDVEHGKLDILGHYMQGVAYVLRPRADVLVIGPGGGIDVAIALHHDCSHVTAVDINPRTIQFVKETYDDFAGGLYNRADVEVINAEGRHYLTRVDGTFDVIQLSGVDTFTALASGAYALSENYLYTLEAIDDFLDHLKPDGVVSFSRWLFTPPRETLRLAITARRALEARGVDDPSRHIMVIAAPAWEELAPWAETLIKPSPFTVGEVDRLREWCHRLRFDVIYDPLQPYEPGSSFDTMTGNAHYDPMVNAKIFSEALRTPSDQLDHYIGDYAYNIVPTTDDSPFFFNFYRMRSLLRPFEKSVGGYSVTRLPLGLMILLASMVQIIVLGGLLILWPMRRQASVIRSRGAISILVYFAAIGLAFIAIEIMFLQKLMVFLGGPVYSMAVTLFSLLVFCGLGSYLSKAIAADDPKRRGAVILLALVAAVLATIWLLNDVLPAMMHLSHEMRCAAAIIALLPVGLLMGMPFPTGIRLAEQLNPAFVPWAWCTNACATVLGSIAAILAAMFVGFSAVVILGAATYGIALLALQSTPRSFASAVSPAAR